MFLGFVCGLVAWKAVVEKGQELFAYAPKGLAQGVGWYGVRASIIKR